MDYRANRLFNGRSPYGGVQHRLDVLLSTTGGVFDADSEGDPSVYEVLTTGEYTYAPTTGEIVCVTRLLCLVEKGPTVDLSKYGTSQLTNGILLSVKTDTGLKHLFNPKPITNIAEWTLLVGTDLPTVDRQFVSLRWTLSKAGVVCVLDGSQGDYFSCELQEDCAGLDNQYMSLQGFKLEPWE
jgi:hypothetical protein